MKTAIYYLLFKFDVVSGILSFGSVCGAGGHLDAFGFGKSKLALSIIVQYPWAAFRRHFRGMYEHI
jgi:hypothetical protein